MPYHLATPQCDGAGNLSGESRNRSLRLSRALGWVKGLEPSTPGTTIRCSNQLSYTHHIQFAATGKMARLKGLEPLTHCLEGSCSIQLSYRRISRRTGLQHLIPIPPFSGAGDGNRTHATSLEGWDSTIELHPHKSYSETVSLDRLSHSAGNVNAFLRKNEKFPAGRADGRGSAGDSFPARPGEGRLGRDATAASAPATPPVSAPAGQISSQAP